MIVQRVRRIVGNPSPKKRKKNPTKKRRKLSAKQILHFGTKRQRAALKAAKHRKRTQASNPKRKKRVMVARKRVVVKKATTRRKRRVSATKNPAHLVTFGFINPSTRRPKKVAKTLKGRKSRARRATSNPRRRAARRSNPKIIVMRAGGGVRRRRRTRVSVSNPKRRTIRRFRGTRNPSFMGQRVSAVQMAKMVAGGLVGVTVTKTVVPMLPDSLTGSPLIRVASSAAVAFAAGWAAGKVSADFGSAVLFGGLMQAGSMAINAFFPQAAGFALSGGRGVGYFAPAAFPVPQIPISGSGTAVGGPAGRPALNRAYPKPY